MKRTVSQKRTPEYPTVSIESDYLRQELSDAWSNLEDQGYGQAPRLQLNLAVPPIDQADNITEKIESNAVYAVIDGTNGDHRRNEQIKLDYSLCVPDTLEDTLQGIEGAVEDLGYEKEFWKIDGFYTPLERNYEDALDDIVEYASSMQVRPNLLVDADLDSSLTIGWFSKAPLSDDVEFGYRAFPNREFENETLQTEEDVHKILGRITGENEEGINEHDLSTIETQKLLDLEHSMADQGLL